jgi:hypothetical protein
MCQIRNRGAMAWQVLFFLSDFWYFSIINQKGIIVSPEAKNKEKTFLQEYDFSSNRFA